MRECLATRERPALTPINPEIRTVMPRHCLAVCLWQEKQIDAAGREFAAAVAEAPAASKTHVDYANFLHENGRTVDALQLLNQFTSAHPAATQAWTTGSQIALSQPALLEVAIDWTAVALNNHPADVVVQAQRAEALLLAGRLAEALPLWTAVPVDGKPRLQAGRIVCQAALGAEIDTPAAHATPAVGQEFVRWYWRLVESGAESTVLRLHDAVDQVTQVLPDASPMLQAVIAKLATA
jgi:hypothetical protein